MDDRIAAEVALLRLHYESVEYVESGGQHWFQVVGMKTVNEWTPAVITVVFSVTQGYPGTAPYGFFVPEEVRYQGGALKIHGPPHPPPFPGSWLFLSWSARDWRATADVKSGSNLWGWVRSFRGRMQEGA